MTIPRALTERNETVKSGVNPDYDPVKSTWISTAEAAALLKIQTRTVLDRIKKGTITGKLSPDLPFTADGEENYVVLLASLPEKAQSTYMMHLYRENGSLVSVDLATPRSTFGDIWISQFINIAKLIQDAALIRTKYRTTGKITTELRRLAGSYGISLSTLYRFEGQPQAKDLSLLYTDPSYLQSKLPKTMCLWSCDLAFALYLDHDNHYSQNDVQEIMDQKRDNVPCTLCPYHPDAKREGWDVDVPVCGKCSNHDEDEPASSCYMIVPNNRKTLNRLLSHIPPQLILFCRRGYREWRSEYGMFSLREKPLLKNACFEGDHHVFDCFVSVRIYKYKNDKRYVQTIAVRPVLTAWMDVATGYIVGWVISVLPNSDTITEAFCRACVPTVGDIAVGLPSSVVVDCGHDYKSKLLEDPCSTYSIENWEDPFLNRRFSGLGVLRSLGCDIYHTIPYHPQSKSIERTFGTIERKYISKLPGWCHNSVSERPDGFDKKLRHMLDNGELLTFESFVDKFGSEILPAYHGSADDPVEHPDLPGWLLSYEHMSPAQRYASLEKARDVIPDWKTMSILKQHYYPEKTTVKSQGVRFQNIYYKSEQLSGIVGDTISILCASFTPPCAPSSITVLGNNGFVCEAFPARYNKYTGESGSVLAELSDIQNQPVKEMRSAVSRISRVASSILPEAAEAPDLSQKDQLREYTYGQTPLPGNDEPDNARPDKDDTMSIIEKSINDISGDTTIFRGTKASYDRAASMLFGTF